MVAQNLDDEKGGSPLFSTLLLLQYDCSIEFWRNWFSFTLWHNPFDPGFWLDARGRSSLPQAMSVRAIWHPWVHSSTSLVVTHGRCRELLPTTVVSPTCKPRVHISWELVMVWCSEVLTFLWPETSSRPSLAKPLDTRDFQLRTPRIDASYLHNSLGVTSVTPWFSQGNKKFRPLHILLCDEVLPYFVLRIEVVCGLNLNLNQNGLNL
jgi:hypothetical protein